MARSLDCDELKRHENWEFFMHRAIFKAFTGQSAPPLRFTRARMILEGRRFTLADPARERDER